MVRKDFIKHCVLVVFVIPVMLLVSCDSTKIFDEYEDIPNFIWNYEFQPEFKVEVEDTSILYNVYINVRHTRFYGFRNIWVKVHTTFPDGDTLQRRVDLPLAEASGRWYGKCTGDICFTQVPIQYNAFFQEPGIYTFRIEQNMRISDLPYIMGIGVRVEEGDKRK